MIAENHNSLDAITFKAIENYRYYNPILRSIMESTISHLHVSNTKYNYNGMPYNSRPLIYLSKDKIMNGQACPLIKKSLLAYSLLILSRGKKYLCFC